MSEEHLQGSGQFRSVFPTGYAVRMACCHYCAAVGTCCYCYSYYHCCCCYSVALPSLGLSLLCLYNFRLDHPGLKVDRNCPWVASLPRGKATSEYCTPWWHLQVMPPLLIPAAIFCFTPGALPLRPFLRMLASLGVSCSVCCAFRRAFCPVPSSPWHWKSILCPRGAPMGRIFTGRRRSFTSTSCPS
jgi:hypothetical protein